MKAPKLILSIFFLIFCISTTYAQVRGNANVYQQQPAAANATYGNLNVNNSQYSQPKTATASFYNDYITVIQSKVLLNKKADSYTAIFHLTQVAKTAADADKFMNERINGMKAQLSALGIAANEIETDIICLVPLFEYEVEKKIFSKKYNEVPKGFELKKNIHIRYTESKMLDKIVTAAAKNEIYDLVKVDYFIKDMEAVYDEMRRAALKNYQKELKMKKDLGMNLDSAYRVAADASSVSFPLESYSSYTAYSSASLDKGKAGRKAKKPVSYYYNPISAKGFDVVINSEILEPVVQFTYDLQVKFLIERPIKKVTQPKIIKKFFVIGENGNVSELPTN